MDPITIALSLAQFAPSILRYFGVGEKPVAMAERVVQIAQTVTGTQSPEAALAAMRENQQFAQQFNLAVLAADTELEKVYLADRANARARDVEVRKVNAGQNRRADVMLICAFVAVIAIAGLLSLGKVDGASAVGGFLLTIGGMFARNIGTAFDFEFGSSRGSKEKDGLIAQMPNGR
ncbi:MAG: hypothetical protein EPO20_14805 [Betaproteobacteria bacterium]|nr:MAG: hypothetical protein EPO20_14805 [Betaproteobacteria bacterium]